MKTELQFRMHICAFQKRINELAAAGKRLKFGSMQGTVKKGYVYFTYGALKNLINFTFSKQPQNLIFAPLNLISLQVIYLSFNQICNLNSQI